MTIHLLCRNGNSASYPFQRHTPQPSTLPFQHPMPQNPSPPSHLTLSNAYLTAPAGTSPRCKPSLQTGNLLSRS